MIKRLKWNVLHADDDDDPGRLSSSDESDQDLSPSAALQKLFENDPQLNPSDAVHNVLQSEAPRSPPQPPSNSRKRRKDSDDELQVHSASSGENSLTSDPGDAEQRETQEKRSASQKQSDGNESEPFYEWGECLLCPGRRFFNDEDISSHLQSRRHLKAIRKTRELQGHEHGRPGKDNLQSEPASNKGAEAVSEPKHKNSASNNLEDICGKTNKSQPTSETHSTHEQRTERQDIKNTDEDYHLQHAEEEAVKRARRKKEAAKRKLKALKRRKWEKINRDVEALPKETASK